MSQNICAFDGCENPVHVKKFGLCKPHYQQKQAGKDMTPVPVEVLTPCALPGCEGYARSRGLCNVHASIGCKFKLETADLIRAYAPRKCDACFTYLDETKKIAFDHDHGCCSGGNTCGECLRGMLCYPCNLALGRCRDKPTQPHLIKYLEDAPHFIREYKWQERYRRRVE